MASFTERLSKDTEGLKEFFENHENVYVYAYAERMISDHLVYLLEKLNLKPEGFILDTTTSDNSTVCGFPAHKFDDVELNEKDGVIIASPEETVSILELKIKEKNYAVDTYRLKGMGIHMEVPEIYDEADPKEGFFGKFNALDELGVKYNTDKSSLRHDYLRKYEMFFQYFREDNINILELGVFHGESIYTFNAKKDGYFKNARVIGVDINPDSKLQIPNPDNFILADTSIEELLEKLKVINPSIIIDDASHIWSHQIKALFILWDALLSGGIYIIEDIDTSFKNSGFKGFDDSVVSAFEICRDISEIVTGGSFIEDTKGNHPFAEEVKKIAEETDMITFVKGSCVIVKK